MDIFVSFSWFGKQKCSGPVCDSTVYSGIDNVFVTRACDPNTIEDIEDLQIAVSEVAREKLGMETISISLIYWKALV